jgi:hypothetical protein
MTTDVPSLTPGTLIDGARMYAAAADAANDKYPNALHVLSHLLGMSIELSLKAFLRHHGSSEKRLRKLGHDLGALLKEAEGSGLDHTGSRHFVLSVLGYNYGHRVFAYPERAMLNVILPRRLRQMASELLEISFRLIKGDALFEQMVKEPGLATLSCYPDDLIASAWVHPAPLSEKDLPVEAAEQSD